jgi:ADP-heptose:LPS heptosyltransferase
MEAPGSYIHITEQEDLSEYQENLKVGIAWEGSPGHSNNQERSCPLKYFRNIHDLPNVQLFSLQKQIHLPNLVEGAENMNLLGADLNDFYDTAKLVNAMDVIVTVDTSILHLAGALETQKPIFALMSYREDPRWAISPWYKNITFLKQTAPGNWWSVFTQLERVMQNLIF